MTEKIIQTLLYKEPTVDIALHPTIPLGAFGIENLSPSRFTT
jgi:hypothetical protein